jgi:hypothetical protein
MCKGLDNQVVKAKLELMRKQVKEELGLENLRSVD